MAKQAEKPLLRWENAPGVLTVQEAALLLRLSPDSLYEMIKEQGWAKEHGEPSPNPLPVLKRGSWILLPNDQLRRWVEREVLR